MSLARMDPNPEEIRWISMVSRRKGTTLETLGVFRNAGPDVREISRATGVPAHVLRTCAPPLECEVYAQSVAH